MSSDKQFPPSAKKLKKAREDGDVAKSRDLSGSVLVCVSLSSIFYLFHRFSALESFFRNYLGFIAEINSNNILVYLKIALKSVSLYTLLFLLLLVFMSLVVETFQVGFHLSFKSLVPDFKKLNPVEGFKKNILKSSQNILTGLFFEVAKTLTITFGSLILYFFILKKYFSSLVFASAELNWNSILYFFSFLILALGSITLVIGICDYLYQRVKRFNRLKMDASEFKQEMKESEGDPQLKGLRKQLRQEIALQNMLEGVKRSKVVIIGRDND